MEAIYNTKNGNNKESKNKPIFLVCDSRRHCYHLLSDDHSCLQKTGRKCDNEDKIESECVWRGASSVFVC